MAKLSKEQMDRTIALYREMPGAPQPPRIDGYAMWGDVEGNDHWRFCEVIVLSMDEAIAAALAPYQRKPLRFG